MVRGTGLCADNAGHGRGPGGNVSGQPAQPQAGQTGHSDSDGSANADPSGGGRRGGPTPRTGITDRDPTDPYRQGGRSGTTTHNNMRARPDGSITIIPASPTPTAAPPAIRPIRPRRPRLPRRRLAGARLAAPRPGAAVRVRGARGFGRGRHRRHRRDLYWPQGWHGGGEKSLPP